MDTQSPQQKRCIGHIWLDLFPGPASLLGSWRTGGAYSWNRYRVCAHCIAVGLSSAQENSVKKLTDHEVRAYGVLTTAEDWNTLYAGWEGYFRAQCYPDIQRDQAIAKLLARKESP